MHYLPAILLPLVSLLAGPLIVVLSAPSFATTPVLVIAPWGADTEAQIVAAGGAVVGPVRAPLGVLAASDDPDFASALRAAGAWAVIGGERIASLCGAPT